VATGLRQGNVKGLEWQYVDLERKHAWIPGSKHVRIDGPDSDCSVAPAIRPGEAPAVGSIRLRPRSSQTAAHEVQH
jgi:integrase